MGRILPVLYSRGLGGSFLAQLWVQRSSTPPACPALRPGEQLSHGPLIPQGAVLLIYCVPKCDLLPHLAADAGGNVSHLDAVEFPDMQVFAIERLDLDLDP